MASKNSYLNFKFRLSLPQRRCLEKEELAELSKTWPMNLVLRPLPELTPADAQAVHLVFQTLLSTHGDSEDKDFGVVLETETGKVLAEVCVDRSTTNPLGHGSMCLVDAFAQRLRTDLPDRYLLNGLDIILRTEPCLMCAMGLTHSRAKRVFYLQPNVTRLGALNPSLHVGKLKTNHKIEAYRKIGDHFHFIN